MTANGSRGMPGMNPRRTAAAPAIVIATWDCESWDVVD